MSDYLYVPSLVSLCIRKLALYPDQIQDVALTYAPSNDFDILKALIPDYPQLSSLNPYLWATLVQIYGSSLPDVFSTLPLSFTDSHLSLLQRIPSSSTFALITILDLPGCSKLTDDIAVSIKSLPSLIAFDASDTAFSSWGIKKLLMPSLAHTGPWALRMLRLRNCKAIDHTIFKVLHHLPLLSVLDLRGTSINSKDIPSPYTKWPSADLEPSLFASLFHPSPLTNSLSVLKDISTNFHSAATTFQLHIQRFNQPDQTNAPLPETAVRTPGEAFTFTSSAMLTHPPQPLEDMGNKRNSDYMLAAAEQESREMVARQRIRNFYAPIRIPSITTDQGYSADKYYAKFNREEQPSTRRNRLWPKSDFSHRPLKRQKLENSDISSALALYRSPPPWSSLKAPSPSDTTPNSRPATASHTAIVNKSKMQMIADLNFGVSTAARSRRTTRDKMATFDGVGAPRPSDDPGRCVLQGKNPFRRPIALTTAPATVSKSEFRGPRAVLSAPTTTSTVTPDRPEAATPLPLPASLPSEASPSLIQRPLKPISSVRVPELPPEELQKLKDAMARRPRTSLPASASVASVSGSTSTIRASLDSSRRKSAPAKGGGGGGKDGDISQIIRQIASTRTPNTQRRVGGIRLDKAPRKQELEQASKTERKRKVGFDWKAWGTN
ncbi:hypothetical protein GYMLUDRAFT_261888 [Collybiopsis luxurians FD-317 M1]|uniref:Uncharacterized protein n=1 Tax=Collybiopsis luxurians FD-317 M1 TaxID=944289 RepID=A0A0D0CMP0_9AGAR|nr:hypothetical protein GYMLUDRAFT_261888 [Collybiopsis luxurians FD-317 M1]